MIHLEEITELNWREQQKLDVRHVFAVLFCYTGERR